jgi:nucleotide-binding universal stress UspA family protein
MTSRKILCAVDFSPTSDEALRVAARLATQRGSELVLAHAWHLAPTSFPGEYSYPAELIAALAEDAKLGLAENVVRARALGATTISSHLLEGPPWQKVVELAEELAGVELIVLGTHGRTGLARVVMGSVAEMVVRHGPCSVLAVPDGGAQPFRRVLVAIDFSETSRRALELAAELAPGSALTLLHVVEPPQRYAVEPYVIDPDRRLVERSRTLLAKWAADVAARHTLTADTQLRMGRASAELRLVLDAPEPFDLVAMGSHGRTGLRRMLLGSVAEKTMRHARRAVLVARGAPSNAGVSW